MHEVKTTKRSKSAGNKFEKKDGGRNAEKFIFCFQRRILGMFFELATRHEFRSNSTENKKPSFYHIPCLKDCGGFKGRRDM